MLPCVPALKPFMCIAQVLDPEGTVFATGQLVGSEQLPVRALAGGRDGAGPALAGAPTGCPWTSVCL